MNKLIKKKNKKPQIPPDHELYLKMGKNDDNFHLSVRKKAINSKTKNRQFNQKMVEVFGTKNYCVFDAITSDFKKAGGGFDGMDTQRGMNQIFNFIKDLKPKDPVESMLILQIFSCHKMSMAATYRSQNLDIPFHQRDIYTKQSVKLFKIFISQMEALKRYRNKGVHKIIVEKVNIKDGGKAVIGDVNTQLNNNGGLK